MVSQFPMLVRYRIAAGLHFERKFTIWDVLVAASLPRLQHRSEPVAPVSLGCRPGTVNVRKYNLNFLFLGK